MNIDGSEEPKTQFHKALEDIISQNFDSVSVAALSTTAKYIENMIFNPTESKYRRINMTNKAYHERVGTAKGGFEFLMAAGFRPEGPIGSASIGSNPDYKHLVFTTDISEDVERELVAQRLKIEKAMTKLGESLKGSSSFDIYTKAMLPPFMVRYEAYSQNRMIIERQAVPFDPFKIAIVRTAPQPRGDGLSTTDQKLAELDARRRELEGDPVSVERNTKAILPGDVVRDTAPMSSNDTSTDAAIAGADSESRLIARSILSSRALCSDEGGAPLTTSSVRALQKAQKEKIYSRTLIKIRFPDRVVVQGYFHPRNTTMDLYDWVASCIDDSIVQVNGEDKNTSSMDLAGRKRALFELYTSPPRKILPNGPPAPPSSSSSVKPTVRPGIGRKGDGSTVPEIVILNELQLVPAAVVNLSWLVDIFDLVYPNATASQTATAGLYLKKELLLQSDDKMRSSSSNLGTGDGVLAFPAGNPLVATTDDGIYNLNASVKVTADGKTDGKKNATGKPKWLKI